MTALSTQTEIDADALVDDLVARSMKAVRVLAAVLGSERIDQLVPLIHPAAERLASAITSGGLPASDDRVLDLVDLDSIVDAASPTGIAVGLARPDTDGVQPTRAAHLLSIPPSRVRQLVESGELDVGPNGRVTRSSIARRLADRRVFLDG
jgi:hypothetical protein